MESNWEWLRKKENLGEVATEIRKLVHKETSTSTFIEIMNWLIAEHEEKTEADIIKKLNELAERMNKLSRKIDMLEKKSDKLDYEY